MAGFLIFFAAGAALAGASGAAAVAGTDGASIGTSGGKGVTLTFPAVCSAEADGVAASGAGAGTGATTGNGVAAGVAEGGAVSAGAAAATGCTGAGGNVAAGGTIQNQNGVGNGMGCAVAGTFHTGMGTQYTGCWARAADDRVMSAAARATQFRLNKMDPLMSPRWGYGRRDGIPEL